MARAAAPRFRGLRVATSTTRRLSNSAGAGNESFYAAKVTGLAWGEGLLENHNRPGRDRNDDRVRHRHSEPPKPRTELTMDWEALFLTLKLDLVVCALLLLIGIPI